MRILALASLVPLILAGCSSEPNDDDGPTQLVLASISAGSSGTCGLNAGGMAICWGGAGTGILPPSATESCPIGGNCSLQATFVNGVVVFQDLEATGFNGHICGATPLDSLTCWGQMRVTYDMITLLSPTPLNLLPGETVIEASAGWTHDCAIISTADAFCWGDNDYNVRGTGGPVTHSYDFVPSLVVGGYTFSHISAGVTHTCGLETSGEAICWGDPEAVGLATAPISTECGLPAACVAAPVRVAQSRHYKEISAGIRATCAIDQLDEVYCWGTEAGNPGAAIEPAKVALPDPVRHISVGGHACAVTTVGSIYCWGRNDEGQIGNGTASAVILPPTKVSSSESFRIVSSGGSHTCALDETGGAWCWGSNWLGELGTGDQTSRARPVKVLEVPDFPPD